MKIVVDLWLGIYYNITRQKGWEVNQVTSKKMGRPIIGEEPKNKQVALRVTETIKTKFQECSVITGKTQTNLFEEMVNDLYNKLTRRKKGEKMEIKINFPPNNREENIMYSTSVESNGVVREVGWKGKFASQWLLQVQKKEDCLILNINEDYLEKQELDVQLDDETNEINTSTHKFIVEIDNKDIDSMRHVMNEYLTMGYTKVTESDYEGDRILIYAKRNED